MLVETRGVINWVEREVRLALSRATREPSFPFIPLLVGEAKSRDLPPFAQQYHAARGASATEPDLLRGLLRAVLQPEARDFRPALESHPFVGLRAFEEGEARLFFGRERETEELVRRLADTPLIMVVGDSGSGKSSLVKAGLVPAFRGGALADLDGDQPDPRRWHVVSLRPRGAPFAGLTEAVVEAARRAGLGLADIDHLRERIRRRDAQSIRDALTDAAPSPKLVLLVIDQFEELWTQTADAERRAFVEVVAALRAGAGEDLRLVLTMRRDYYNLVSEFPDFFTQLEAADGRAKFVTRRMANEAMREAILKPLSLTDAWNEAAAQNLAERVLRDAGDRPGDLALLQMALAEAWRARGEGQDLLAAYLRRGGVAGALAQAAQEVLDRKLAREPEPLVRGVFLRLARLGEAGGATRRIARRDEFDADGWNIVQRLAGSDFVEGDAGASTRPLARLVAIAGEPGEETAEILHEALFTQWPPYVRWLREWGADKRVLDRLADDVAEWRREGVAARPLASGADLEVFRALRDGSETGVWLSPDERRFVNESEQAQNAATERAAAQAAEILRLTNARADAEHARAQEAARSATRARRLTAAAAVLAFLALIGAGVAFLSYIDSEVAAGLWRTEQMRSAAGWAAEEEQRNRAEEQRRTAEAAAQRALENESMALASLSNVARGEGRGADALRLAVASWPRRREDQRPALLRALQAIEHATTLPSETVPPMRHEGEVWSAVFSPDGRRVVTVSQDGAARLWDAASGAPVGTPIRHEVAVDSAAFSPDGRLVVTASGDSTARLWDAASGAPLGTPMRHEAGVTSAAFSPDGRLVVTASWDNTVRLWNAASGAPLGAPMRHEREVNAAAISPDGRLVVTASSPGRARLWNTANGAPIGAPMRHEGGIWSAAFSPDGRRVVTASADRTARLWDAARGAPIGAPMRHEGPVWSVAFSPDGKRVLTASGDRTARLWDAASGAPLGAPMRHDGEVRSAAFSPDGRWVLTASLDGTARLWDAASGATVRAPTRHEGSVVSAAFSPDGRRLVTASEDRTARLWDAASGAPVGAPMRHEERVYSAAFSPDGRRVVTASWDGTARLWDATTGAPVGLSMRHQGAVNSAAFSTDGTRVVTASSEERTVRLWDAASGAPLGPPMRHEIGVTSAAFSPDGRLLVTASLDGTARLWDAPTGAPVGAPMRHVDVVASAAFSADGQLVVTASHDRTARLWNAASGAPVGAPMRHEQPVYSAAFSPDGRLVVTASLDGTARLWGAAGGGPIGAPMRHEDVVRSAAFSPDGRLVVTASVDRTARLWDVSWLQRPLPQIACALLPEIRAGHARGDLSTLARYGIEIRDPICEAPGPPFDPARIDPR